MDIIAVPPLTTRALTWQEQPGQWNLTVICKITFALVPGTSLVAVEQEEINEHDNHWDDDPKKSIYAPSDLAPFKPRPEILLVGSAYAPRGELVRSLFVRLVVAELDKSIEVVAPRSLDLEGTLAEGNRWTQMPLRYERAAGGGDSWNRVGIDTSAPDAYGRRSLPNLQPVGAAEGDVAVPAIGFGPIAARWPIRRDKLGSLAEHFVGDRWTEVAIGMDFDGSYFQSAPLDQQIDAIRPDEPIMLENMHPEHERLATRLPGIMPRTRVEIEGLPPWELELVADTLWIDTNRGICAVTWRGQLPLDGRDQPGTIRIGLERPGEPVRFPETPRPPPVVASPPPVEEIDDELTQTSDEALRMTGAHVPFQPAPALPFQPSQGAPPRMPPAVPKPRPSRTIDDPDETAVIDAPRIRDRMPTWLGGVGTEAPAMPAPPIAPPPIPPAPASRPPAPPPPVTQLFRGPQAPPPLAGQTPAAPPSVLPGIVAPPASVAPPLPPASLAPRVGTTVGQAAVLAASKARAAPPRSTAPPPVAPSREPSRPRSTQPDPRTLATAAFLGAAEASNAAAISPPKDESDKLTRSTPDRSAASANGRTLVDLLWFDPELGPRLEENDAWKRILDADKPVEEPEPEEPVWTPDPDNPEDLPPPPRKKRKKPPEKEKTAEEKAKEERSRVAKVISRGSPTFDVESALFSAIDDDGVLAPPLCVVAGDLELPFDEVETLKVLTSAAAPLATGDKKLKETLDLANEALGTPLGSSPEVAASFSIRVREAWIKANRMLPPDYLDVHSRRVLLEQRKYQLRELAGASWIRALLHGTSGERPAPTYLPADLAKKLPLFTRFSARLVVELSPQQDQNESHPVALRVLALARTLASRTRR